MSELKPCPFCSSDNIDNSCRENDGTADFYYIACFACEAMGPTDYDQAEAERLWNERSDSK